MIKGLELKGKSAAAFGSYGWSGECVKIITEELEEAGLQVLNDGIRELWNPDEAGLERCREFGKSILENL